MSLEWVIETYENVPSTQDIAIEAAHSGRPEGFVVQAEQQSGGRGRHGRVWQSQSGNLFLSILFRPGCIIQNIGQLSLLAGLSLIETINGFADVRASLKWPNDVLIDGKKCAGLLLESELSDGHQVEWVVIGLGVNIVSAPAEIGSAIGEYSHIDRDEFRDAFLNVLAENYKYWQLEGFDALRLRWLSCAHEKGSAITVKIGDRLEKGAFHDIDALGNLRLVDESGALKTISSGEVYL